MADTASVWAGITVNFDNLIGTDGYDWYNVSITVGASTYRLLHGYMVAGLSEMDTKLVDAETAAAAAGAALPTIRYAWDAGTTDVDPGTGEVAGNHATIASITTLYLSTTDDGAADVTNLIATFDDSTSTIRGFLAIGHRTDPTKWAVYSVSGSITSATGYRKVTVAYVAGPGGFVAADDVALGFVRTGDKGDTGATGSDGVNGSGPNWGGTSGGSANTQTLTPAVVLGSLTGNPSYEWLAGFSVSSTATLNVSGTGAVALCNADGSALVGTEVVVGTKYVTTLTDSGTKWRLAGGGASLGRFADIDEAASYSLALTY